MPRPISRPLHIAASLRVVAKHLHMPKLSIATARAAVERAAKPTTNEERAMVEELERVTGLSIAELVERSKAWLPKG